MILAGDIGGTNTRLALVENKNGQVKIKHLKKYASQEHHNLADIVRIFLNEGHLQVTHACFGIAGPVVDGVVHTTNLPWVVDSNELRRQMNVENVWLINDLAANTWGISLLNDDDFITLNRGSSGAVGNAAVISAGTGLGQAGLYFDGKKHHPFACEGGHTDFSPRNELEIELLVYLSKQYDHVSWERLVSGPGLYNIYCFLRDTARGEEPSWLADKLKAHDAARVITENAMAGTSQLCVKTLDLFVSFYGAEAGNLALKTMALGGVYIGGGIAPKILPKLREPAFMQEFTNKGRMKVLLQRMPVKIILNENTSLLGAAEYAHVYARQE